MYKVPHGSVLAVDFVIRNLDGSFVNVWRESETGSEMGKTKQVD